MRIAVSGSHHTGKTALIDELCSVLPNYSSVAEPFFLLEEQSHLFSHPPSVDDYILQLNYSIDLIINTSDENVFFDRCPLDMLAYLKATNGHERLDFNELNPKIQTALNRLNLIIFLPIEKPDRIICEETEFAELRNTVNDELYELVFNEFGELGFDAFEIAGSIDARTKEALRLIGNR